MQQEGHMRAISLFLLVISLVACGGGGGSSPAPEPEPQPPVAQPPVSDPPTDTEVPEEKVTQIDVLVVLGQNADRFFADVDQRVQHTINLMNDAMDVGEVPVYFNIVHTVQTSYPEAIDTKTALEDITYARHSSLANIHRLRDTYRADVVIFYRRSVNDGFCGRAWLGGNGTNGDMSGYEDFAYGVVAIDCPDPVTAHEIGHIMGLDHDENTSPINQGTFPYSRGFAVQGSFVTIMGESSNNGGVARLPMFSSPEYYCAGFTCGIPDEVDAIRSIKNVYEQIANYRN